MTRTGNSAQPPRVGASMPASPVHRELPEPERRRLTSLLQRLGQQAISAALGAAPAPEAGERGDSAQKRLPGGVPHDVSGTADPVVLEAYLRVVGAAANGATAMLEVAVPSTGGGSSLGRCTVLPDEDDGVDTTRMLLRLGANGF